MIKHPYSDTCTCTACKSAPTRERTLLQQRRAIILQRNLEEGRAFDAVFRGRRPIGVSPGLGDYERFLRGPLVVRKGMDEDPQELNFEA